MKKLITLVLAAFLAFTMVGCQKNTATVTMGCSDPEGNHFELTTQLPEGAMLKELFDAFSENYEVEYELSDDGYLYAMFGVGNDEKGHWEVKINDEYVDSITDRQLTDGENYQVTYVVAEGEPTMVGGWQTSEVAREELTDEEKEDFLKATESLEGSEFEPVTVLATQVVNGTNIAYLALEKTPSDDNDDYFDVVKIYKSLDGEVELVSVTNINPSMIETGETPNGLTGGWAITDSGRPGSLGSDEVQASFDQALANIDDMIFNPVQLLASQLVNGTNYMALARGKSLEDEGQLQLYVVTWNRDLDGNATLMDVSPFDLLAYLDS